MAVNVGDKAPDFQLPAADGMYVRLSDRLRLGVVVLFFYPKDFTPGCTAEVCSFRDSYEAFVDAGAEVIGISSDDEASHAQFAARHQLQYTLLADSDGTVRKLYGVPKTFGLLPGRVTYVIGRDGTVLRVFSSQLNIQKHISEALDVLGTQSDGRN